MPEPLTNSRTAANRIGDQIQRSFENYLNSWQDWIVPMIVAGFITVVSLLCCWIPYIFVMGPLTCGLHLCALASLRNRPVNTNVLMQGWQRFSSSLAAVIVINTFAMLPMILIFGLMLGFAVTVTTLAPQPVIQDFEFLEDNAVFEPEPVPEGDPAEQDGEFADELPIDEPSAMEILAMLSGMLVFYAVAFFGIMLLWAWQLWITTRMLFVFPLIADRGLGCGDSIRTSWRETRERFWELFFVNLAGQFISMIGMSFMYIGLIFTIPLGTTIIASAYEGHFNPPADLEEEALTEQDDMNS